MAKLYFLMRCFLSTGEHDVSMQWMKVLNIEWRSGSQRLVLEIIQMKLALNKTNDSFQMWLLENQ
ncbi:hypothetical protein AF72_02655 [Xylella taiwanensis]|uniref:Uncharacterized protein n=1 Tax=Xylella taiwanensis TaxID=1444770 RepID=Z9JMY1_9GAMM|nr:hypothetical protein AB672_08800 [Xylella taiwanensis]EWS79092.1 hypothetical protein AF72_02655 [Xylella taiwanensis]